MDTTTDTQPDLTVIEDLDFAPVCDGPTCNLTAEWQFSQLLSCQCSEESICCDPHLRQYQDWRGRFDSATPNGVGRCRKCGLPCRVVHESWVRL